MEKAISLSFSKRLKQHNALGCEYSPGLIPSPNKSKNQKTSGFTIVELLVVIVVIGILAAITIVSYTGITARANIATVQADLSNASKKLSIYNTLYGTYPQSMTLDVNGNWCPSAPSTDTDYCIKPSKGTFAYTASSPYTDFTLRLDSGTTAYNITKDTPPTNLITTPITAIAATTGTAQIGQTLTAGAITPGTATVSYQWQAATTAGGTYSNIPNATNSTYIVSPNTMGKYIKVAVTGTGSYSSNQTSNATAQVPVDNTNWATIGSQTWAKANLNVGIRIAGATAQTNNGGTNIVEKYCYGNTDAGCTNTDANGIPYGALYQWNEAMGYGTTEGAQGICPAGSHVPSDNDWKILEVSLGMTQAQADTQDAWRGTNQGTQLKSGGSSGLNMPLASLRFSDGSFGILSLDALLWSSSESGGLAWYRDLYTSQAAVYRNTGTKAVGFSVRCLGN